MKKKQAEWRNRWTAQREIKNEKHIQVGNGNGNGMLMLMHGFISDIIIASLFKLCQAYSSW